jgi:DNA-directed RNA polymerase subunit RPC12/RpoP
MDRVEIVRQIRHFRQDGSHWIEAYERTEYFCPKCGKQGLWVATHEDYYIGKIGVCEHCWSYCYNAAECYECSEEFKLKWRENANKTYSNS